MSNMLAKVKERWAGRGPLVSGLPVPRRKQRSANRAREKDALRRDDEDQRREDAR